MKYLMLVADGFEDVEMLGTLDVLQRGGEEVKLASMMSRLDIKTKCGYTFTVNDLIEDLKLEDYDALIIPGGPGSFKVMAFMPKTDEIIKYFADNGKVVCAICAAPFLVGRLGYFKDKHFTVHPGFEGEIIGGTYDRDKGVVIDGKFITGKSMFYSIEFGLAIYKYFNGEEAETKLRKACQGEKA